MRLYRRTAAAAAVLVAAAIALVFVAAKPAHHDSKKPAHTATYTAADGSFSVRYPAGWKATSVGKTSALLERADRRGVVLVREHPALRGTLASVVKGLPRALSKRFPDFRPVSASVARLATGPAVVYTFVRTRANKLQSIVVAPAPAAHRSFTLEVVAPVSARDAARQAGQIVHSLTAL